MKDSGGWASRHEAVVMLAGEGESTNILYHALAGRIPLFLVIVEAAWSRATVLQRRLRSLGPMTVAGQAAFGMLALPLVRRASRRRTEELKRRFGFVDAPIPAARLERVSSVNADETIRRLQELAPDVVLVHGTRIIHRRVLDRLDSTVINLHAGITPTYRGVHGGYWALARCDPQRCGVTVHLVDPGIDTGPVIAQATCTPERDDTFVTYPYHQLHAGIPLLERAVTDALAGSLRFEAPAGGASRLWTHPTLAQYVWNLAAHGVR